MTCILCPRSVQAAMVWSREQENSMRMSGATSRSVTQDL